MNELLRRFTPEDAWVFRLPPERQPDYPTVPGFHYLRDTPPKRGGFGFVYHASQATPTRPVALKVAHESGASEEANRRAQCVHPNIVAVHTAGEVGGRPYLVVEWMGGGSLFEKLHRKDVLSPRQWARLWVDLADALAAVHVIGIHRDIKPANILFADSGTAKLADFGLAVRGDTATADSGTTGYHITGEPHTRLSDIYALGVTFWQCLIGSVEPKKVPDAPPANVPRTLFEIAKKCTAKEPAARYGHSAQPAAAVAGDLRAWLEDRATLARPLGVFRRAALFSRRWRVALSVSVALTGAAVTSGILAWQTVQSLERERVAQEATNKANAKELEAVREAGEAKARELEAVRKARADHYERQLTTAGELLHGGKSPEAVQVLMSCEEVFRKDDPRWESLIGRCDTPLAEVKFPSRVAAVISDGKGNVAVGLWGGEVFVGPLTKELPKAGAHREPASREMQRLFFAADGRLLVASVSRTPGRLATVVIGDRQSGVTVRENLLPEEYPADGPAEPALSPDGKSLIFPGAHGRLKRLDVATGQVQIVAEKLPPISALAWRTGDTIAAAVKDDVRFWKNGAELPTVKTGKLRSVDFAADDTMIGVDGSGALKMWSADRTPLSPEIKLPRINIRRVIAAPGRSDVFATIGDKVTVWTKRGESLTPRDFVGTAVAFSTDGSRVFTGDAEGTVREWSTRVKR